MPGFTRCFSVSESGTVVFHVEHSWDVVSSPLSIYDTKVYQAFSKHSVETNSLYGYHPGTGTATKLMLQHKPWDLPHHRLVHECLSHRLDEFSEVRELVIAIRDASAAHSEAARLADIIHPDVCPRNIKIQRDQDGQARGYLIDWDHSTNHIPQLKRHSTWQFTAIRLLSGNHNDDEQPVPIQNRIDGVESFFHLLFWMALRYTAHGMSSTELTASLREIFDSFRWKPEKGGICATGCRTMGLWPFDDLLIDARFGNEGIHAVLQNMRQVLHERYTRPEALYLDLKAFNSVPLLKEEAEIGQIVKGRALKFLDDPRWLPDLLDELLRHKKIDRDTNRDRKEYELSEIQFSNPYTRFLC